MLATRCEEPTPWKRPWCWERLKARGGSGDRGWDGWMELLMQWTWLWAHTLKDRQAWQAVLYGIAKSWTWLSDWTATTTIRGPIFGRSHKLFWSYWPSLRNQVSLSLAHFQLISPENRPLPLHSWPSSTTLMMHFHRHAPPKECPWSAQVWVCILSPEQDD